MGRHNGARRVLPAGRLLSIVILLPSGAASAGSPDRSALDEAVRAEQSRIQDCYESALERKPLLSGKIVITFRVDPKGSTTESQVKSSTLRDKTMEECIRRIFESVSLPAIECLEDAPNDCLRTFHYPLTFTPLRPAP